MSSELFDIIFRGDIVLGHQLQDVKLRMQQLFKADAEKIDALFTGRPVPLKRNVDDATAQKYAEVLTKAGAQVQVCPAGSVKLQTPSGASPTRPSAQRQPAGWSLAPVGTYLLRPTEKARITPVIIDTSAISLRPAAGNLLDAGEVKSVSPVSVASGDFELAETGSDLLREEEKMSLPLVEVASEDWGLAEVGSDLLSAAERPQTVTPALIIGDYGLAPVGSDLGQIKPAVKPVVPDISQIHLAE